VKKKRRGATKKSGLELKEERKRGGEVQALVRLKKREVLRSPGQKAEHNEGGREETF